MHSKKKPFRKKWLRTIGIIILICLILIQFIQFKIDAPPAIGEIQAPAAVKEIFQRACYDCHSNETNLRWYDRIAPASWLVTKDIREGRKGLNFSNWSHLTSGEQQAKLWEIVNQVAAGAMPLSQYTRIHPAAAIKDADLAVLKQYVMTFIHRGPADSNLIKGAEMQYAPPKDLPVTLNGISYIPDYKNWQTISTTDRFDNNTMRVIFGNDIAIKAIRENKMTAWPNGTIFAKVAWDKLEDKDGNVRTGAFKQVEYMIKDDLKYASTKGWGWARFRTPKMVPYGTTALFTTECVNCHLPMRNNDFVFSFPIKK